MKTKDQKFETARAVRRRSAQTDDTAEVKRSKSSPSEEQIRRRAHEIYLTRGAEPGYALLDWLRAEQELKAELEHPAPMDAA